MCVFCAYTCGTKERGRWCISGERHFRNINLKQPRPRRYMRHAFHRPLRPAFHFYLYLPGRPTSFPSSRIVDRIVSRCPPPGSPPGYAAEKGLRFSIYILRHFVSNPRGGEDVAGDSSRGIVGPYSTFMALNRDEVSSRVADAPPLLLPASSSSFFLFFFFYLVRS